tara:strand:+ start:5057 stop:5593 length:537 start_codon:yes stop_codon:yes gene_type:complete
MANMRMDDLGKIVQDTLDRMIKSVTHDIENDVMESVAEQIETIFRREMRMAGVNRSEKTGTHDLRSQSEKEGYYKWGGSVLGTDHRVAEYDNEVTAYGGVPSGRDYVARFLDQGTDRRMAWHHEREQKNTLGGPDHQEALNFRENAAKVIKSRAQEMTQKGVEKACKRVKPTIVKRTF